MSGLSIIIPCLHDLDALQGALQRLSGWEDCEIIVADASEQPACREIARKMGATALHCVRKGRGYQLNEGTALATGEIFVFAHSDTFLEHRHLNAIAAAFANPATTCATFYRDHRAHYPLLRCFHSFARWYARNAGIIYGDQVMVFRRSLFEKLGGFPDVPIMEDVAMSGRMRKLKGLVFLDPEIRTSMRRFHRRGFVRNKLRNILIIWLWRCGMKPETIYKWYYNNR